MSIFSLFKCFYFFICLSLTQQALPDDSYTTEDHDVFTVAGRSCIEEGDSAQVLSIVLDEKNQVRRSELITVSAGRLVRKCVAHRAAYHLLHPSFCRT